MEFTRSSRGLVMHQQKYAKELLERFKMHVCNAARIPLEANVKLGKDEAEEEVDETRFKQIIGSLRFLCNSRPDLMFGVGLVSRFMSQPRKSHMESVKRILRYIRGTSNYGILFPYGSQENCLELTGYCDSDYGGDTVERKSTSGFIYFMDGAPVSWSSKKQSVVALSSCEAEYVSGCYAACQRVWLEELLRELQMILEKPVKLKMDNTSAINLARNPVSHGRSKHIEVRFHFLRDIVNKERIELCYCKATEQLADLFTKPLAADKFEVMREKIGIVSLKDLN